MKIKEINPIHLRALECATLVLDKRAKQVGAEVYSVELTQVTEDDVLWDDAELEAYVGYELTKRGLLFSEIKAGHSNLGPTFCTVLVY